MVGEGYGVFRKGRDIYLVNKTFSWQSFAYHTPYFIGYPLPCTNKDYTQIVAHSLVEWEKPDESTSNGSFT